MTDFTLSRRPDRVLPETVTDGEGHEIPVDADFRAVLRCLRVIRDPSLNDAEKTALICHWFLRDRFCADCTRMLFTFLAGDGRRDEENPVPVMDFEKDADAIYTSFYQVYGMDLLEIPFLHWHKFRVLLGGLGSDCALGRRIALRTLDTSRMNPQDRARAERAKRSVQLDGPQMTAEEAGLQRALDEALSAGQDPAPAVRALNEYYARMGGDT